MTSSGTMSLLFARVFKQAQITFDKKNRDIIKSNFAQLKNLVSELQLQDLNINPQAVSKTAFQLGRAPCKFISIHENPDFTMSCKIFKFFFSENY